MKAIVILLAGAGAYLLFVSSQRGFEQVRLVSTGRMVACESYHETLEGDDETTWYAVRADYEVAGTRYTLHDVIFHRWNEPLYVLDSLDKSSEDIHLIFYDPHAPHAASVTGDFSPIIMAWIAGLRGVFSIYTIACGLYIAASLIPKLAWPELGSQLVPW